MDATSMQRDLGQQQQALSSALIELSALKAILPIVISELYKSDHKLRLAVNAATERLIVTIETEAAKRNVDVSATVAAIKTWSSGVAI